MFTQRSVLGPVCLLGLGTALPERVVTNHELARTLDTSDEWIHTRTGIRERRVAGPQTATSDLAVQAARAAISDARIDPGEVDLLLVATMTPDQPTPATAVFTQRKLGLGTIPAFDLAAACTGFLYGLEMAAALVAVGQYRRVLLIGAEKMSSIVDWSDRSTCVLFGDAAAATIVGIPDAATPPGPCPQVVDSMLHADGRGAELLHIPAGGTRCPPSLAALSSRDHLMKMSGKEVFKLAVREMASVTERLLERHGLAGSDLRLVIPHQANTRIIDALAQRLGTPPDRVFINIGSYGNTSAASIPLALAEAREQGRLPAVGWGLLVAFGAGLTWGATLLRFG
jgi:3-oxoacyl-[acyl-carrier-protein] synthase III